MRRLRTRGKRLRGTAGILLVCAGMLFHPGIRVRAQQDPPEVVRSLIREGDRQRESGNLSEAADAYRQAVEIDPSTVAAWVGLGAIEHQRGNLEEALSAFSRGLEHAPRNPELLYNAAVLSLQLDRLEEALGYADRAVSTQRRDARLHALRGSILRRLGRLDQALEDLRMTVELSPREASAHFRLGNLFYEMGRLDDAIDAYREAVKRDPDLLRAHYNLGAVLFEAGRDEEAIRAYDIALQPIDAAFERGEPVDPVHARAYENLGAMHLRRDNHEAALAAYEKALELEPDNASTYYNLGYVHFELGREDAAFEAYEKGMELEPSPPLPVLLHLAAIHSRRGDPEATLRRLEGNLDRFEGDDRRRATFLLADAYRSLEQYGEAEAAYRRVLQEEPADLRAVLGLAEVLRRNGDAEDATELLEEARRTHPESTALALELAAVAHARGDRARERGLYLEIMARDGDTPAELWPVELNLAVLDLEEERVAEARQRLGALIERWTRDGGSNERGSGALAPRDARLLSTAYALLLAREGSRDDARRLLASVLAEDPELFPAQHAVAALEALDGDLEAAVRRLEALLSGKDPVLETLAQGSLGQILWLAGRPREARPHLEAAAQLAGWITPRVLLGEIALEEEQLNRAVSTLSPVVAECDREPAPRPVPPAPDSAEQRWLQVALGEGVDGPESICRRARRGLGVALVGRSLEELGGDRSATALRAAERALRLPLTERQRAVGLYVRGTARLLDGETSTARDDLRSALDTGLDDSLRPLAENNLGIALYRLGSTEEARRLLESASASQSAATLNLGILHDEEDRDRQALESYEEYLRKGGSRSAEVSEWVDSLKRFFP